MVPVWLGTYVKVTEVLVVVEGIADNKLVGDFKSSVCERTGLLDHM